MEIVEIREKRWHTDPQRLRVCAGIFMSIWKQQRIFSLRNAFAFVLVGIAVVGVVAAVVCSCVLGIVPAVRVVSGSMAETLVGPHVVVTCDRCGFVFRCGVDCPPEDSHVLCPNCGHGMWEESEQTHSVLGDRVWINRLAYWFHRPRRWDVVVIRPEGDTDADKTLKVKRVIGLPGEQVAIRDGDIYINGQIARKSLRQFRNLAMLVYDSHFVPAEPSSPTATNEPVRQRWIGDRSSSRWQVHRSEAVYTASPEAKTEGPDWLVYCNWPCWSMATGWIGEVPVADNYGYNQGLSRSKLNDVTDLLLTCRVKATKFRLRIHDGWEWFELQCDATDQSARLLRDGKEVAKIEGVPFSDHRWMSIEYALCDRQVLLGINGRTWLTYAYTPPKEKPKKGVTRPIEIGAKGVPVTVRDMRVYRDIYYLNPMGEGGYWKADRPLGDDQLFLLGDNCPISEDSRHWENGGGVPIREVVGRIMAFH